MSAGRKRRAAGFTLLEAVVAMVLISTAGMALFTWINASINSLTHVHDANLRSEATTNVLEYMQEVNPMATPEGTAALGAYAIRWHAEPISPITDSTTYPAGVGLYQLALYATDIAVTRPDGNDWFDLHVRLIGYRKSRASPVPG